MTALPNNDRTVRLAPSAGATALPYDFWIGRAEDLAVWRVRGGAATLLTLTIDYTVSGAGSDAGGTVTLGAAAQAGDAYVLAGAWLVTQVLDLVAYGDFRADDLDHQHRLILAALMEIRRDLSRQLGFAIYDDGAAPFEAGGRPVRGLSYLEFGEATVAAPAADKLRLYAKDVDGVTKLFARTATQDIMLSGAEEAASAAAASAAAALASAAAADDAADAAEAAAATLSLPPLAGNALKVLRVRNDETAYELADPGSAAVNPAPLVGVNATADTTNRLSVASAASLFSHEGSGHQQKINKAAAGDTASVIYQTGASDRAHVGLIGSDDLTVRVSPDGSTWHDAMVVDKDTGAVVFPNTAIDFGWSLGVTADGGSLTIALKTADGNDPSSTNPVAPLFRSATGATGAMTRRKVTSATSLTVSSGSTLGVTSSTAFRLWVVAFDDGGTVRMGVVNATTYTGSVVTSILSLPDNGIASSTAEGGPGGADSAGVIYTGTAVTSKPYRILGWVEWSASGVTAGTWTTTNVALVQAYNVGLPTPGQLTGRRSAVHKTDTFTSTTGTAWTDITGYSASLTPTSAANAVRWSFDAYVSVGAANGAGLRMVRGSTAIGVGDADGSRTQVTGLLNRAADTNSASLIGQRGFDLPQSASSTTYKVQFFLQADTFYFNRATNTTDSNVVFRPMSSIIVEEVMT